MKALAIGLAAAALGGCAGMLDPGNTPKAVLDPAASQWEGWVRFSEEEFQLYPREVQVLRPFSRPCLSGALPLNLQRQAVRDLGGQKVRVTGRTTPWTGREAGNRIDHAGSDITNVCGGQAVILAESMVAIP